MPRVHFVKRARKDYGEIKKGQSYYWWKFRYCAKSRSITPPTPQQLTQSAFWSQVYDLQDQMSNITNEDERDELVEQIREFADEQSEKRTNMPDSLYDSPTGELLGEREDSLNQWADELEAIEFDEEEEIDLPNYEGQ